MQQIGPYEILKELGRGGMGVVYRGVDKVIGRHVAIKTLRPEDMGDGGDKATMGDRLLREARSAGILSHPNIVTIYQAGQDGDILYIAMEFIDGANLADILAQGKLNTETVLKILKQSAEALDYAHSKGVVHRDIKPGNIMIEPSGKIKIADFGIAKLNQAGVTKTTSSVGSPAYMSPEHVRAQTIDGRADQYSLGVVAYEMLTGRRPHDSEELTSLVFKVVFEPPDLSILRSQPKGESLEPIFSKVLAKAADDRYPNCTEFYEALASVLEDRPAGLIASSATAVVPSATSALQQGPVSHMATVAVGSGSMPGAGTQRPAATNPDLPPPPSPPSSNKGLLFGGIGVLVIALAAGGYFMTKSPSGGGGGGTTAGNTGGTEVKQEKASPPVLIQQPECSHTPETQALNKSGAVGLVFEVTENGDVDNVRVSKSLHPLIDARAAECIKSWRFQPSRLHGKAVRSAPMGAEIAF